MNALTPLEEGNWDYFSKNMSNHIVPDPAPDKVALGRKFEQATLCATMVGLSDFAGYTQSGQKVASPKFPYRLFFVPMVHSSLTSAETAYDIVDDLTKFPVGTTL